MTDPGYFDSLYTDNDDPWDLSSSAYERRKLGLLMTALPRRRYARAFEPGCAIGVTTLALAERCEALIAMDGASVAVAQARARVRGCHCVRVEQGRVPDDWPDGSFDLVVLSELLYYLDEGDRLGVSARIVQSLAPGGDLVSVHWRHPFPEAATTGDMAQAELAERLGPNGFELVVAHVEEDFRLEVYRRCG
jgi:SAM-dependent methyltransferase